MASHAYKRHATTTLFAALDVATDLWERQDHGVIWRLQVERDDVGGFLRVYRIGTDASAAPPLQRNPMRGQHPPDLALGDVAQMVRTSSGPFHRS
jgi:hypothetical protein